MSQSKHKILITDYAWATLEPEREVLSAIGAELIVAKTGTEIEFLKYAPDVDGILTNWAKVTTDVVKAAEKCRVIGRYGIGLDNIDVATATSLGMVVFNVPTYCLEEVSDHAMALVLAMARKIPRLNNEVKNRSWDRNIGPQMYRIRGQKLGIVGFGKIGKLIVPKAKGFGMEILAYSPSLTDKVAKTYGVKNVDFEELLTEADFITIHCPLVPETNNLIDADALSKMKSTAYLINTARGGIVNHDALFQALQENWIAGAGLDVLPEEPPADNFSLLDLDNVIITPHAAFWSEESINDLQISAAKGVLNVLTGNIPDAIVNPEVLQSTNQRFRPK
ncbi:TPA: C-terminal binding protein [Candidatus Poribacteria bacterium]|jgi:D-3-phosphoglycerate dehydrogenase|nr:C-terminal binding protein [Candidatus Poribacteria bacterium]HIA66292.1 C-terminal binding protein [Candidatus Poribacteria bacterium]HIB91540.1 C-terminal binding protein [Candidatus Poribacteria bacterium]HIC01964.1 C-terminal binding protein [Candidatus Poribacteria bacterium]HIN27611.1 C-terminal binding protein [Candidatus Poribacteria bacterium]